MARPSKKETDAVAAAEQAAKNARVMEKLEGKGISDLIDLLLDFREATAEEVKKMKLKVDRGNAMMGLIEAVLMKKMKDAGTETGSGTKGSAYYQTKTFCGVSDWDALLPWIVEHENHNFLKKDVAKSAVEEYMEANEGALPPGVRWDSEKEIVIRKK